MLLKSNPGGCQFKAASRATRLARDRATARTAAGAVMPTGCAGGGSRRIWSAIHRPGLRVMGKLRSLFPSCTSGGVLPAGLQEPTGVGCRASNAAGGAGGAQRDV
jgi:hypothetical protein